MHRRRLMPLFLVGILVSLLTMACDSNVLPFGSPTATPPAAEPGTNANDDIVSAEGIVVPYRDADLSFKASGRVQEVLVSEGDQVTAGQELARLNTRDLEQEILQAEAGLKSAQAELAKVLAGARLEEIASAKADVTIADAGAASAETAIAVVEGTLAEAQLDVQAAQDAGDVIRGNLAAAQALVSSAQASLSKLQAGATQREIQIAQKQVALAEAQQYRQELQRDALGASSGALAAAETRVHLANLELAQVKDPPRPEDVAIAEAAISEAQADVATIRSQLAQALLEVAQAQTGVQTAQAQLVQAQAEVESASAQQAKARADLALVQAGSREQDIEVAQAAVAQAEVALAEAQNALEDAVLSSPLDGTVGALMIEEGELVSAHSVVLRLGDLRQLRVDTEDLSEVDVDRVRLGQPAVVTADALGGQEFPGTVTEIAPVATDHRGDTVYTVTVDLGVGPESGLRWGMSTFVEIQVR